jgi:hypothetical protein
MTLEITRGRKRRRLFARPRAFWMGADRFLVMVVEKSGNVYRRTREEGASRKTVRVRLNNDASMNSSEPHFRCVWTGGRREVAVARREVWR